MKDGKKEINRSMRQEYVDKGDGKEVRQKREGHTRSQ